MIEIIRQFQPNIALWFSTTKWVHHPLSASAVAIFTQIWEYLASTPNFINPQHLRISRRAKSILIFWPSPLRNWYTQKTTVPVFDIEFFPSANISTISHRNERTIYRILLYPCTYALGRFYHSATVPPVAVLPLELHSALSEIVAKPVPSINNASSTT